MYKMRTNFLISSHFVRSYPVNIPSAHAIIIVLSVLGLDWLCIVLLSSRAYRVYLLGNTILTTPLRHSHNIVHRISVYVNLIPRLIA